MEQSTLTKLRKNIGDKTPHCGDCSPNIDSVQKDYSCCAEVFWENIKIFLHFLSEATFTNMD